LKVQSIVDEIQTCRKNGKEHFEGMQDETNKLALKYQPVEKRGTGRSKRDGKTSSCKRVEEYKINKLVHSSRRRVINLVKICLPVIEYLRTRGQTNEQTILIAAPQGCGARKHC
jgi:hypothetical protein